MDAATLTAWARQRATEALGEQASDRDLTAVSMHIIRAYTKGVTTGLLQASVDYENRRAA